MRDYTCCAICGTEFGCQKSRWHRKLDTDDWVCSKKCAIEYALGYFNLPLSILRKRKKKM